MDLDALSKILQDWTNRVPLLIVGSGASVPYNLPSMWALGEFLKNSISFSGLDDQKQFDEFKLLLDKCKDLEKSLFEINIRPNVLQKIVSQTWELVNKCDLEAYEVFLKNPVSFPFADLVKHLLGTAEKKISVITTNYDRLVEYAASLAGAFICTGYSQNYISHFSNGIHQNNFAGLKGYKGQANIWKVHGSLDWFKNSDDIDIQLPLRHSIPDNYRASIVTPGLNKYFETHTEPYRTIFSQADNEIEKAFGYLCIGYGFNDVHVQPKLIKEIRNQKPIIVITKELTENTKKAIINNNCKNYLLFEQDKNPANTRIYSSALGEDFIPNSSYWMLGEYLKLLKP